MLRVSLFTVLASMCMRANLCAIGDADVINPAGQDFTQTLVMIGIALVFFYFILWRPEQKRRKELEDQRNSMKKGDKVVAMGILGSILKVQDQTVIVKMYDGSKIEFLKGAISEVFPATEDEAKRAEKEDN